MPGTFDTIDELAPGASATFTDSVPVELLATSGEPGVYWIGIHALGDSSVPRDLVADGRARTFIPRVASGGAQPREASVILPIRSRVWFDEDGAVAGTDRWAQRLAEGGSLDGVLDMADSAGSAPYSWLVDPAVLHALARLANGNPPRTLTPDPNVPGQEPAPVEPPEDGEETPTTPGETLTPTQPVPAEEPTDEEAQLAASAAAWLERFKLLVGATPVLTLPYGDIDVSASIRNDRTRFDQAVARGAEVMTALTLPSQPTVAPENDLLSPEAVAAMPLGTTILLGDNAFAIPPTSPTSVVRLLGHEVVVTSTGAEAGGPGPDGVQRPPRPAAAAAQRGRPAPRGRRHRAARRHPADGVARRGRRVVLHRPRAVVARPGPPRGHRRPHAQGRPGREPHLHRRRHRRGARPRVLLRRQPAPARPPPCWSRWSSR